jgi:hypothetical protein
MILKFYLVKINMVYICQSDNHLHFYSTKFSIEVSSFLLFDELKENMWANWNWYLILHWMVYTFLVLKNLIDLGLSDTRKEKILLKDYFIYSCIRYQNCCDFYYWL